MLFRKAAVFLAALVMLRTMPAAQVPPEESVPMASQPQVADSSGNFSANAEALDGEIDAIARNNAVGACTAVVFEGEKLLYEHSYGIAATRSGVSIPASSDTKYRVASISKMITALLTMTVCEQGKLSLDDDISKVIHEKLYHPGYPEDRPTIFHLLTHTSGIYDTGAYSGAISTIPFPSLDSVLNTNPFADKPWVDYEYSNFGMGLMAAAIERATGERFYDYANRMLFDPLDADAGFLTDFVEDKANIAVLAAVDPLSWGEMKRFYSPIPLGQTYLLAQGEAFISGPDLAKIAMILAGDGTYNGQRYLTEESVAQINKPYVRIGEETYRGLAVQISRDLVNGVELIGHQGNAYGCISCVFYDPLTKRGVIFLTNQASAVKLENQVYKVNQEVVQAAWRYFA